MTLYELVTAKRGTAPASGFPYRTLDEAKRVGAMILSKNPDLFVAIRVIKRR